MKCTYNTFLEHFSRRRGESRGGSCDDLLQVCWNSDITWSCSNPNMEVLKRLLRSPSHGVPPPQSPTNLPAVVLLHLLKRPRCLDDLSDAAPHPLHFPQSPQIQSLNPTSLSNLADAAIATRLAPPPPQPCTSELEVHRIICLPLYDLQDWQLLPTRYAC